MGLAGRWKFTLAAVAIAVLALAVSQLGLFGKSSEECRPVKDMLAFNKAQAEQIASKTADSKGVPTIAEEGAYQAWADGLAERAQNVHEPELAADATQLASLANEFVGKFSEVRVAAGSRAPGAPAPPAVFQMDILNSQIADTLKKLTDACG
ncbi:MAG TPA: hypothetical protein VJR50_21830 [Mycobacterium sp.]|jgi:hypothetical protein|nr:hypothetical protein [Mycobacterium sp.]